jgi:catechol 2,3-dioxygenase-like lactoylglutathione lyase family enzyme
MAVHVDERGPSAFDVCIQVRDPEACLHFYRDVLGFEVHGEMDVAARRIWGLRLGPCGLRIVHDRRALTAANPRIGAHERAYGYFMMAICVTNGAEIVRSCEEHGFEVEVPFSPYPPGAGSGGAEDGYAYIRDPEGNMIELLQGVPWSPPAASRS